MSFTYLEWQFGCHSKVEFPLGWAHFVGPARPADWNLRQYGLASKIQPPKKSSFLARLSHFDGGPTRLSLAVALHNRKLILNWLKHSAMRDQSDLEKGYPLRPDCWSLTSKLSKLSIWKRQLFQLYWSDFCWDQGPVKEKRNQISNICIDILILFEIEVLFNAMYLCRLGKEGSSLKDDLLNKSYWTKKTKIANLRWHNLRTGPLIVKAYNQIFTYLLFTIHLKSFKIQLSPNFFIATFSNKTSKLCNSFGHIVTWTIRGRP